MMDAKRSENDDSALSNQPLVEEAAAAAATDVTNGEQTELEAEAVEPLPASEDQQQQQDELLIDEADREGKMFEEGEEAAAREVIESGGVAEENQEALELVDPNGTLDENNASLNESESILEMTNAESESGQREGGGGGGEGGVEGDATSAMLNESLDEVETEPKHHGGGGGKRGDHDSAVYSKKDTIRRKTRPPNRFADGNLIPEEDDNQVRDSFFFLFNLFFLLFLFIK